MFRQLTALVNEDRCRSEGGFDQYPVIKAVICFTAFFNRNCYAEIAVLNVKRTRSVHAVEPRALNPSTDWRHHEQQ